MVRAVWLGLLAASLCANYALAQDKVVKPDWIKKPSSEDLFSAWPTAAKGGGVGRIKCTITLQGTLRGCKIDSESPAGEGFGAAALALAPQFVLRPLTVNGAARESEITIPITFQCPDGMQSGSFLKPNCRPETMGTSRILSGVVWGAAPTFDDVLAAYPDKARERKASGVASLSCIINATGKLGDCDVMSEQPENLGFGSAARKLAAKFGEPANFAPDKTKRSAVRLTFAFDKGLLDGAHAVGRPKWTSGPTMAQALALYPKAALADNIKEGRATLRCRITEGGVLADCASVSELPADKGFGAAALALMPSMRVQTWSEEGLPVVGGEVRVPIAFKLDELPGEAAKPAG
jgi:TonB family protein